MGDVKRCRGERQRTEEQCEVRVVEQKVTEVSETTRQGAYMLNIKSNKT